MALNLPGNDRVIPEIRLETTSQELTFQVEVDGALDATATGLSVQLFKPAQNLDNPIVIPETPTFSAGVAKLVFSAADKDKFPLGEDYRALWSFTTTGGRPLVKEQLFDVVRELLIPFIPLRIDDLKRFDSRIDFALGQSGQDADAFQRYIQPAWWDVLNWVRSHGRRPALIADSVVLYPATRLRALWYVAMGLREADDDSWSTLAKGLDEQWARAKSETVLRYRTADGFEVDTIRGWQQPELGAGPDIFSKRIALWRTAPVRGR